MRKKKQKRKQKGTNSGRGGGGEARAHFFGGGRRGVGDFLGTFLSCFFAFI